MDCSCGDEIAPKRAAIGYRTCLTCGEVAAKREIAAKANRTLTLHKGVTVYAGDGSKAKQYAKDVYNMRRGTND